jgi:hypothetical protein
MHLHECKRLVLKGIIRTRRGGYEQGGNEQMSGLEIKGIKLITFPVKAHTNRGYVDLSCKEWWEMADLILCRTLV